MKKLFLVILIVLTTLTGCSQSTQKNESDTIMSGTEKQTNVSAINEAEQAEYKPPKMEGEIFISAMTEQEFLKIAANKFMQKYPKVKVKINAYRGAEKDAGESPSEEYSTEKYRNYLNTKIMTGKAEDIIFTAQLPVKKYVDMGVFEDLSRYLSFSKEINKENYFMNILESPKDVNGKIFVLPYMCSFQAISFDSRLVSENNNKFDSTMNNISFEKAAVFGQNLIANTKKKNAYLSQESATNFLSYILKGKLKKFIDKENKKANINTQEYITLLKETKDLIKKGPLLTSSNIDFYNTEYYFAFRLQNDIQAAFNNLTSGSGDCYALPMSDIDGNIYTNPNYSLGINSASKNKELAWEFIKYLLSDEIQSSPSLYGLCINKKGFQASIDRNYKLNSNGGESNVNKEEFKSLLEKWVMQINAYDTIDPVIWDFFTEENSKYFDEKQSAEETAEVLNSKINKYLNE